MGNYYSTFSETGIHRFDRGQVEYGRLGTNNFWRFGENNGGPVFGGANAGRRVEVVDDEAQFRLTFSPNSTGVHTDFFSNPSGNLLIQPNGGRVGINLLVNPTHNLEVNGSTRIRNIPIATPNCILVGTNQTGVSDNQISRLDFTGNSNQVLLGNGTWGNMSQGLGNYCSQPQNGLLENFEIPLNNH